MPQADTNGLDSASPLRLSSSLRERITNTVFTLCALLSSTIVLSLIAIFFWQLASQLSRVAKVDDPQSLPSSVDLWMILNGTVLTTAVALSIAVPIGLAGALYLSDFASRRTRLIFKGLLEVLAAVPPIVWAFFAVTGLSDLVSTNNPSALLAGITLGLMVLPMTATLMEDAIFHVPTPVLEGAVALGATRFQTLARVVLPTAAPGLAAATLLSLSRAVAETVVLCLAAGDVMRFTIDPRLAVETVTGFILRTGTDPQRTEAHLEAAFMAGAVLFIITGILHIMASRLLRRKAT